MAEAANYQAVLADLIARRARLDHLIAGIKAEMAVQPDALPGPELDSPNAAHPNAVDIHPDSFFGLSIIEAAKKFLRMARRAQHLTAIASALEQGGLKRPTDNVMSGILVRAAKGREVTKVGKGMWGLSDWYPKPPKEQTEERRSSRKATPTKGSGKKKARRGKATTKTQPAAQTARATVSEKTGLRPSDVAIEVMRAAGKPLHAVEITKRVNERGVPAFRLPIESFLNRQTKAGKMQKVAASTFSLAS
jgi:hypothetical protein